MEKKMKLRSNCNRVRYLFMVLFMCRLLLPAAPTVQDCERITDLNARFRCILVNMKEFYDNGDLENVISLYQEKCHKQGKKKEEKEFKRTNKEIRAGIYQFIFLSYTEMDMPDAADSILEKYLAIRPHEKVGEIAWMAIRKSAKEKYYVVPRFLVGLKMGTNFTLVDPGPRYTVLVPVDAAEKDYQKDYDFHLTHSRGTHLGIVLEYALTQNLSITTQPTISTVKFQYENPLRKGTPLELRYVHRHKLGYIELPLLFKYRLKAGKGKLKPYFQIGGYYSMLKSGVKRLEAVGPGYDEKTIVDIKEQFSTSNIGLWIGAGVGIGIKIVGKDVWVQLEVNYRHGLNNIVDKARRYENKVLMFAYYDVFDDMKLRNWDLSVKIVFPLSYKAFRR